jgi:hypothetical protein
MLNSKEKNVYYRGPRNYSTFNIFSAPDPPPLTLFPCTLHEMGLCNEIHLVFCVIYSMASEFQVLEVIRIVMYDLCV